MSPARPTRGPRARAALTAAAVAAPLTVVLALAFARFAGDPAQPQGGPTAAPRAAAPACTRLLQQLPTRLDGLTREEPPTGWRYAAAWGTPAVTLRCGVLRPAQLQPYSTAGLIGSGDTLTVNWLPTPEGDGTVWTTVDRSVYIAVTVPSSYSTPPINTLSNTIAAALPAVCRVSTTGPTTTGGAGAVLCTHRR